MTDLWKYGITTKESQAMADALIAVAVEMGPRMEGYPGYDPEEFIGYDPVRWAQEGEDEEKRSDEPEDERSYVFARMYCTAARALGIL